MTPGIAGAPRTVGTVEVDQKALIEKILGCYSSEHSVFRELLQNADDARSKNVEITFGTTISRPTTLAPSQATPVPSLPDLEKVQISKWTFKNDGDPFQPDDWDRLTKIAKGNPDASKIGAFGVGFYTVFSITENPIVTSGNEVMRFNWNGNELCFDRDKLPNEDAAWTSFEMNLRVPAAMATKPLDFARFCATSITFMNHIRRISVSIDQYPLFTISKTPGSTKPAAYSQKLNHQSPCMHMTMTSVSVRDLDVETSVTRWVYAHGSNSPVPQGKKTAKPKERSFFARLKSFPSQLGSAFASKQVDTELSVQTIPDEEKLQAINRSLRLQIYTGNISVNLPPETRSGIERVTKKQSPSSMEYHIIYTDKDRYDEGVKEDASSVFQGLRADLDGTGSAKLFIGHATAQSTGVGGHHASRFIPTVEREALNLDDAAVALFNKELLAMGGLLSRVIYEVEMDAISQQWRYRAINPDSSKQAAEDRFVHLLRFFAFRESTPNPLVSHTMKTAFLASSESIGTSFRLLSTAGVKPSTEICCYNEELCGFLKTTPYLGFDASSMAESLLISGTVAPIRDVDMKDILHELHSRQLDEEEMIKCLKWRLSLDDSIVKQHQQFLKDDFLAAAKVSIPAGVIGAGRDITLSEISTFWSPSNGVIKDSPLPPHTLPTRLADALPLDKLAAAFSWKPLSPFVWLQFLAGDAAKTIVDDFRIDRSTSFAEQVLVSMAEKAWMSKMSWGERAEIEAALKGVSCIPTNLGLRKPSDSHFPNPDILPGLAIVGVVGVEKEGPLRRMLEDIGVRDHVDPQIILKRVFDKKSRQLEGSTSNLIRCFVRVEDKLKNAEIEKLGQTPMFLAAPSDSGTKAKRYRAKDLYEPSSENITLGLPVLAWPEPVWDSKSPEARFMFRLGLIEHPSVDILIDKACSDDIQQNVALHYLLEHFHRRYDPHYQFGIHGHKAFVPAVFPDGSVKLLSPAKIFAHKGCAMLGFPVIRDDIHREREKLKIPDHPEASQLIERLVAFPPKTVEAQGKIFEYLSTQIDRIGDDLLNSLRDASFIRKVEENAYVKPSECYFRSGEGTIHAKHFVLVDPSSTGARSFLDACGVREEPSPQQVVDILLRDPQLFFRLSGSESAYLEELRPIATNLNARPGCIDQKTRGAMESAPIFLAYKAATGRTGATSNYGPRGEDTYETRLLPPAEISIVDDMVKYRLFKDSVWTAPREDALEKFYQSFGSQPMSSRVEEIIDASGEGSAKVAEEIKQLILERLPLFLYNYDSKPMEFGLAWFQEPMNFVVKAVRFLTVRDILKLGSEVIPKSRGAGAGATRTDDGPVILYIAASGYNEKPDLIEVAHSICQVMFKQLTGNDSLLLSTILATELTALERIGYDVDRIMRHHLEPAGSHAGVPAGAGTTALPRNPSLPPVASLGTGHEQVVNANGLPPDHSRHTAMGEVDNKMQLALSACRKGHGRQIKDGKQKPIGTELQFTSYCDESSNVDIRFIRRVAGYEIWMANDERITKLDALIEANLGVIERLAAILTPLRDEVYRIGDSAVSIFYDFEGPLVAFNRDDCIFVNLRVYKQWYDELVTSGGLDDAISFYYFVFGHEIAHNLVDAHNADHEILFAKLCEKHLSLLTQSLVGF